MFLCLSFLWSKLSMSLFKFSDSFRWSLAIRRNFCRLCSYAPTSLLLFDRRDILLDKHFTLLSDSERLRAVSLSAGNELKKSKTTIRVSSRIRSRDDQRVNSAALSELPSNFSVSLEPSMSESVSVVSSGVPWAMYVSSTESKCIVVNWYEVSKVFRVSHFLRHFLLDIEWLKPRFSRSTLQKQYGPIVGLLYAR